MLFHIAPGSDGFGPLYGRIATLMRQRIRDGLWRPGEQLPTLEDLVVEFGASRVTLRQALDLLERDGLIARHRGRGTFVTQAAAGFQWITLGRSWQGLLESIDGTRPKLLNSADVAVPPGMAGSDGLAPSYRRLERVHSRHGVPFAAMRLHVDRRRYDLAPHRFDVEPVIPLLAELPGPRIALGRQILTVGGAEPDVAAHLELPLGAPVGILRRVIADDTGCAIYVGDLVYRGDTIRMQVDLDIPREPAA